MTPERFRRLTEAYGAMPEHWPAAERAEAKALLAQRDPAYWPRWPTAARSTVLSRHSVAAPEPDLVRRILASAPVGAATSGTRLEKAAMVALRRGSRGRGRGGNRGGRACHLVDGSFYATPSNPPSLFDQTGESTVFSSTPADWSDQ